MKKVGLSNCTVCDGGLRTSLFLSSIFRLLIDSKDELLSHTFTFAVLLYARKFECRFVTLGCDQAPACARCILLAGMVQQPHPVLEGFIQSVDLMDST